MENVRKFTSGRTSKIAPGKQIYTILSLGGSVLLTVSGAVYHLDSKIDSNAATLRAENATNSVRFESFRSEILNAISSAQGERVRALEVEMAAIKKR